MTLPKDSVAATTLAKQTRCERQMILDERYGQVLSKKAEASIANGNRVHELIYRKGHTPSSKDTRCFIASVVFGIDADETVFLRQYRDRTLLAGRVGRSAVALYYRASPAIADFLRQHPACATVARWLLMLLIRGLRP